MNQVRGTKKNCSKYKNITRSNAVAWREMVHFEWFFDGYNAARDTKSVWGIQSQCGGNTMSMWGIQTMSVWGRTTSIVACIWPPQNKSSIGKELNIKWPNGRNVQNMEQFRTSKHNHWRRLDQVNFAFLLYSKSSCQNPSFAFCWSRAVS